MKGKQQMIIYSKFTEWLNSCPVYYEVQSSEEYIEDNNSMSILFDMKIRERKNI